MGVLGGILLVLALALPARAQTTYQTEGPVFGGELYIFSCDAQTTFAGGTVEWLARYGQPGERSLGTFELTTVYSAEGVAYGGAATSPRRATYFRATWTCEPTAA
jgi:hypothetical protein